MTDHLNGSSDANMPSGTSPGSGADARLYAMRVVTRMTGLPADTIRAWERRYDAVVPERTEGNARRYSEAQIRKLSLLRELTEAGHAIRSIANLAIAELEEMAAPGSSEESADTAMDAVADAYLASVARLDTATASRVLTQAASVLDNHALVFELVLPILRQVGERWSVGDLSVAHEHLVSAEMRALVAARARRSPASAGAPRMIVATPAGHLHEFGVLAAAMLASGRGIDVIYLGPDVPPTDLLWSATASSADVVTLGISRTLADDEIPALVAGLQTLAQQARVWVGAPATVTFTSPDGVRVFRTLEDFDVACASLAR